MKNLMQEMKKPKITLIFAAYCLIILVQAFFTGGLGSVNLLPLGGAFAATFMYLNRYEGKKIQDFAFKAALGAIALGAVVSLIMSFFGGNIVIDLIANLCSAVTSVAIVYLFAKKFHYPEICEFKIFVIMMAVCLLILPSVLILIHGVLMLVIAVVLLAAAIFFIIKSPDIIFNIKQDETYIDNRGFAHDTISGAGQANEGYKQEEQNKQ